MKLVITLEPKDAEDDDEQYRENMNEMKTEREAKTLYSENLNIHAPPGWCAQHLCLWRCSSSIKNVLW